MIVEFSVVPLDTGESVSEFVARTIPIVEESGLANELTPMGTVLEGDWDEIMAVIKSCHEAVLADSARVVTGIKIDDRPGKPKDRITAKVKSVCDKAKS